ncbi:MAG: aspartyl protease family protein, partial [Candidatus Eremiobacteraeota bacterium]|nr:aspartyl protease family protein [Candidatus Eremiobacteraeota bacterium]
AVEQLEIHAMAFAARAALLCVMAILTTAAGPQPPLSSVLAHMRAVNGTPFNYHIKSTSAASSGATAYYSESQGLRFLNRGCTETLCTGTYFDGERSFNVNINDTMLPRSPEIQYTVRALRLVLSLAFLDPQFTHSGGRIVDEGYVQLDGKRMRRLLIGDGVSAMTEAYVDPQSWLIGAVGDLDEHDVVFLRDYRRVGPLMLPFSLARNGETLERYKTREIVMAPLEAPRGLQFEHTDVSATVPMDSASATPVLPCTVGGVNVKCLIDTGNSGLSISLELAEQLNAPTVGAFEVSGLGHYATGVVRTGPLIIGNLRFAEPNFVVLHDIRSYGYDVVVGADVLAQTALLLDPARHLATFGAPVPADGDTVGLTYENLVPVIPIRLDETETVLLLDTGDESSINLSYDYYRQHPTLFKPTRTQTVSGVGGSSTEVVGDIPQVAIGGFVLPNQVIGATETLKGTAHGHIGAQVLSHFALYLDYPHSRIVLQARSGDGAVQRGR